MAAFQLATILTTATMLRSGRSALLRAPWPCRAGRVSLCSTPNSSASLPQAVFRSIETHVCGSVLISVSGGSDSVALLRVLIELNSQLRWDLAAVHFNHGFRRESEEEEVFVRSLAAEHGVPMHVRRLAEADRALANGVRSTHVPGAARRASPSFRPSVRRPSMARVAVSSRAVRSCLVTMRTISWRRLCSRGCAAAT